MLHAAGNIPGIHVEEDGNGNMGIYGIMGESFLCGFQTRYDSHGPYYSDLRQPSP